MVNKHQRQLAVRAMRGKVWSPGRPSTARREDRVRFWEAIATGLSSEDAAAAAGVSSAVGSRWFRHAGGMSPILLAPVSGRYLSFEEREEIAILHAQHVGVREIARPAGPLAVNNLAGAGPQRIDTHQRADISGVDGAVARRAAGQPPEGVQACWE